MPCLHYIPLNLAYEEHPVCNVKHGIDLAKVLQDCFIIIWDECTISHKNGIVIRKNAVRFKEQP